MRILIILLLITSKAHAGLSIGISTLAFKNELNYNSDKFRPKVTIGWLENFNKWNIGLHTTRLNHSQKRSLENGLDVKNKVISDILKLGYRVNRFSPNVFIANSIVKTTVSNRVNKETFIAYGFGVDYLVTKNISIGISAIMPNKIGHGASVNLNYNF